MSEDLLSQLPEISFRGIKFPYVSFAVKGSNNYSELTPLRGKGSFIDMVSQSSPSFSIEVPCIQNLDRGPNETGDYTQLFTKTLPLLLNAMDSTEPGTLIDPIRGSIVVKPLDYAYTIAEDKRNGTILSLNFILHVEDSATQEELKPLDLLSTAENFNLQYEDTVRELVSGLTAGNPLLTDWAGFVTGAIGQVNLATLSFKGKIDNTLNKIHQIKSAADSLESTIQSAEITPPIPGDPLSKTLIALTQLGNPKLAPAAMRDSLNDMEYACNRAIAAGKNPGKATKKFLVQVDTIITAVAQQTRTSVSDLCLLNPFLNSIKRGIVPGPTLITVFL